MSSPINPDNFCLYAITDRRALPGGDPLPFLERAVAAGVDMIQIREKDLSDSDLFSLVSRAVEIARGQGSKVLVNDRIDVAVASGAHGVHIGSRSAPVEAVRAAAPPGFLIGVSTHNREEVAVAVKGGADFITFGPVFRTPSKALYGPPVGLVPLEEICRDFPLPVLPLGGINEGNIQRLLDLPVAGLAAISLFQEAENLNRLVTLLKREARAGRGRSLSPLGHEGGLGR